MQVYDHAPLPSPPEPPVVRIHTHPKWFYIVLAVCAIAFTVTHVDRELAYCPASVAASK